MNKPEFQRYETLQGVEYEVLSSNKKTYYTVPLVNGKGAGCQCRFAEFNPFCKHQERAEQEEALYQKDKQPQTVQGPDWHVDAPLNGNKAFSLLRQ